MKDITHDFDRLWHGLRFEERERMMPHMMKTQKLHLLQCRATAVHAHKNHLEELDCLIGNLDKELNKYLVAGSRFERLAKRVREHVDNHHCVAAGGGWQLMRYDCLVNDLEEFLDNIEKENAQNDRLSTTGEKDCSPFRTDDF